VRTTDPISIASTVSTTSHTTTPDQGGSGRSAYATIREHNCDTVLTNDVERPAAYTISVCFKRHRSLKIILQSSPLSIDTSLRTTPHRSSNGFCSPDSPRVRKRQ
jgi:hypothetical protein